jgi:hypothetical protein
VEDSLQPHLELGTDPSRRHDRTGRRRHAGPSLGAKDLRRGNVPRRRSLGEEARGLRQRSQLGDPVSGDTGAVLFERLRIASGVCPAASQATPAQGEDEAKESATENSSNDSCIPTRRTGTRSVRRPPSRS